MDTNDSTDLAIQGLRVCRKEILSRISHLQGCLKHTDGLLEMLGSNGHTEVATSPQQTAGDSQLPHEDSAYAGLKTQRATEKFLEEHLGRWFKASAVAKELLRLGLPHGGKAFASTIAGALNRAVQKGIAVRKKRDGVYGYSWKIEEPVRQIMTTTE